MDHRRHGKRALPADSSEDNPHEYRQDYEEEEHQMFPAYSPRSQQDMSAIVSALSQVIGTTTATSGGGGGSDIAYSTSTTPNQPPQSQELGKTF